MAKYSYEIMDAFFKDCLVWDSPYEIYWYKKAWDTLDKCGLCGYTNEIEQCEIYLRALAIIHIYYDFCCHVFDDADFLSYKSYHGLLDDSIDDTTLGILAGKFVPHEAEPFASPEYLTYKLIKTKIPEVLSALQKHLTNDDIITWMYCTKCIKNYYHHSIPNYGVLVCDDSIMHAHIDNYSAFCLFYDKESQTLQKLIGEHYDYPDSLKWLLTLNDSQNNYDTAPNAQANRGKESQNSVKKHRTTLIIIAVVILAFALGIISTQPNEIDEWIMVPFAGGGILFAAWVVLYGLFWIGYVIYMIFFDCNRKK